MTAGFVSLSYILAAVLFILALKWMSSPASARRGVLAGEVGPGAWTPSRAFGADFVASLPGVSVQPLSA